MDIDFNGETIEVDIPEGFHASDAVLIVRSVSLHRPGVSSLSMGITNHTDGVVQAGMLTLITGAESYAYEEDDDD